MMEEWFDRQVDRKWAGWVVGVACVAALTVSLIATSSSPAPGQIVPGPPTTPQPTVPCTPPTGCGRAGGVQRDVGFAWIDRYCNGDAVPTPVGFTTFSLNYGLGGQSLSPAQFFGVVTINGAVVPTNPLALLQPGQKDTRVRAVEVPVGAVVEFTITGTSTNTGAPLIFGNGTAVRIRSAAGDCPTALVPTPGVAPPPAGAPPAAGPPATTPGEPFTSVPPGGSSPRACNDSVM